MMWIPKHVGVSWNFEPSSFKVSAAENFLSVSIAESSRHRQNP